MKAFLIIITYIILYTPLKFIGTIVMNITGIPGSLIAFKATSKKEPKYIIGLILCFIAHSYTYFAIMIYIMNWTRHLINPESISKYFIWFFSLILFTGTIEGIFRTAKNEFRENKSRQINTIDYLNTQIESLDILRVFVFIGFFVFIFFPNLSNPLWSWVNQIGFLI